MKLRAGSNVLIVKKFNSYIPGENVKMRCINLAVLTYFAEILDTHGYPCVSIFVALGRPISPLDYTHNYQASAQSGNQAH